jgi:type VII secretion-associated protein (TIGR03931 family)
MLRSLHCGSREGVTVVHPSWWPASRVEVVTKAARTLSHDPDYLVAQARSSLLRQASPDSDESVVVEIADRLVAIGGTEVVGVPRLTEPHPVAEEVARVIAGMEPATVLIDGPHTVAGAPGLATLIADAVRGTGHKVLRVDDTRLPGLARLAGAARSPQPSEPQAAATRGRVRSRGRTLAAVAAAGMVLAVLGPTVPTVPRVAPGGRHDAAPAVIAPTTFLVEGRVALTVPASWTAQRVVTGPGSARVQVTSPTDPEVALHVTQSAVVGETLSSTAERLKQAIAAERDGVFVDFNPSGSSAGRPAVTYREVRAAHQVRWTVLLDGSVQISVGCQSRPGGEDPVRDACDQAVRSAHAVG